jgi:hypothetical protein
VAGFRRNDIISKVDGSVISCAADWDAKVVPRFKFGLGMAVKGMRRNNDLDYMMVLPRKPRGFTVAGGRSKATNKRRSVKKKKSTKSASSLSSKKKKKSSSSTAAAATTTTTTESKSNKKRRSAAAASSSSSPLTRKKATRSRKKKPATPASASRQRPHVRVAIKNRVTAKRAGGAPASATKAAAKAAPVTVFTKAVVAETLQAATIQGAADAAASTMSSGGAADYAQSVQQEEDARVAAYKDAISCISSLLASAKA